MISSYFRTISQQYYDLFVEAKANELPAPNQKTCNILLALAGFFLILAAVLFSTQGYQALFEDINKYSTAFPPFALHLLTSFGDSGLILALILFITPKHIRFHWVTLIAGILGAIISRQLKNYFDLPRPPAVLSEDLINIVGEAYAQNSFPSGHSLTAFLMATAAIFFVHSWKSKLLLIAMASAVCLSRVLVGVHWPIDILVGAALGIICGLISVFAAYKLHGKLNKATHLFILFLFVLACFYLFFNQNDYPYANLFLYTAGITGLYRFAHSYLVPISTYKYKLFRSSPNMHALVSFTKQPKHWFVFLLVLLTAYRIVVIFQPHVALFYDEIYYYHWSLHPDLGYYSKPPMVAWCIWLSTQLLGPSMLGIKLAAPLLYAASAVNIYFIGKKLSHPKDIGAYAGIIFLSIPLVGFNSEFITTDAPLFFFWSLSLYFFLLAVESNRTLHWALLGLATGLGMLSKYTMGALPLGLFLYLLSSTKNRHLLSQNGPWLAAVLAGLIFAINIYWNFSHDWIAAKHTQEISQTSGGLFDFGSLLSFLFVQLFIFGPIWSYLLLRHGRDLFSPNSGLSIESGEAVKILLFSSASILGAISLQAFLSRAFANWAGPWVIGASLLLAICFIRIPKRWMGRGLLAHLLLLSTFYHWPQFAENVAIPLSKKTDPYYRVLGWQSLGEKLSPILEAHPQATLLSNSRDLLAYMGYYGQTGNTKLARWQEDPNNIRDWYDLKFNLREHIGDSSKTYIFISKDKLNETVYKQFVALEPLSQLQVDVYDNLQRNLYIYKAVGFKGYEGTEKL